VCSQVISPDELPRGSACSCHLAPFTFGDPTSSLVLRLHVHTPPLIPCRPPTEGPVCNERDLPFQRTENMELSMLCSHGPCSLSAAYCSPVSSISPCAFTDPRLLLLAVKGMADMVRYGSTCCHPIPRSLPCGPWLPSLCQRPDYKVPSPHVKLPHVGSQTKVISS
jgi:hypothetical protein